MRQVFNAFVRGVAVVSVMVLLSASVDAAPREGAKEKVPAITKLMRMIRALGDGLTVPLPSPKP